MSFSKLARIGYEYKKSCKTPQNIQDKKQIKDEMAARIITERINTVYEETDESFLD